METGSLGQSWKAVLLGGHAPGSGEAVKCGTEQLKGRGRGALGSCLRGINCSLLFVYLFYFETWFHYVARAPLSW
jgi:hypothetical protein